MTPAADLPLDVLLQRALARLQRVEPVLAEDARLRERAARVLLASDFALDTLCAQPGLLARMDGPPAPPPAPDPSDEAAWAARLRRWRAAESTRLVWRDVLGLDTVEDTLAGSTRIATEALAAAHALARDQVAARHGVVRDGEGREQSLVVFGLGKLGGGELNFSSDVDLIYA